MSRINQNLWKWLFETVFVLALVLISFLTILAFLNLFFPSGQSLFQLVQGAREDRSSTGSLRGSERYVTVGIGDREGNLADSSSMTATLARMTNNVKSRRSDAIAWADAVPGMPLFDRDAVQTGRKSTARLAFGQSHFLDMDENSLMIIRNMERDIFLDVNRTVAVLIEGQFSGKIGRPERGSLSVDLVTAGAVARFPAPVDNDDPSTFKMIVNSDESSVLTIYSGRAELLFQDQTLEVKSNQIVKVQPGKGPIFLPPPPLPPEPVLPENGEVITFRETPPRVAFIWKSVKNSPRYRFMLAKDKRFENIVYEQVTSRTSFSHGNLKPGEYFWRIASIGPEEEGGFSQSRRLLMIQDLLPPSLQVRLPDNPGNEEDLLLTGTTDPDAALYVNGSPTQVNEHGEFEYRLELKTGWNVLVLEAVDQVGNVAYYSSTFNVQR